MEKKRTIQILEALASGCSPKTGEMLPAETVLNQLEVIRALQFAIDQLQITPASIPKRKIADNRFKEIDYFKNDRFNNLGDAAIVRLKERVRSLGVTKTENLPDYIVKARERYPRAYEPWSEEEKEILTKTIEFTNDLDLLSECFQRGKNSVETVGQKIVFESLQK